MIVPRAELLLLPGPRLDLPAHDVGASPGILAILRGGPHCVSEMAAALDVR